MSDNRLRSMAVGMLATVMIAGMIVFVLVLAGREAQYDGWGFRGFPSLLAVPFAFTGFFILKRLPRHGVGWVFLLLGFTSSVQGLLFEYMLYSLVLYPETIPGGLQVAWLLESYWVGIIFLVGLLLLLFPSGSFTSPQWRRYALWIFALLAVFVSIMSIMPGKMDSSFAELENPYGWEALRPISETLKKTTSLVFLVCFGPPVVGLIGRFRTAKGVERQQYKWFVYAAVIMVVTGMFTASSQLLGLQIIFILTILLLPIALGNAVLRYRLYDIDFIIRRTLQYALLTGLLVLIYFTIVILFQNLLENLTGDQSQVGIVISTLAIAALFNPLRLRVQEVIDRLFYRKRYDAELALSKFSATARDEVDRDRLSIALLAVVEETMQPESASLWLVLSDHTSISGEIAGKAS